MKRPVGNGGLWGGVVPSYQNPTAITLPLERRRALLAIAQRYNVLLIEDDVYCPFLDAPQQSFASMAPDLMVYVSGFSKFVAPGLRLGFVVAPRALVGDIAAAVRINYWSISPLTALIATAMLEDGVINDLVMRQKEDLRRRQALVSRILANFDIRTGDTSTHFWLHLPEPWPSASARRRVRSVGCHAGKKQIHQLRVKGELSLRCRVVAPFQRRPADHKTIRAGRDCLREASVMRSVLLWILEVPVPVILLALFINSLQ
ncbi:aminotransferase class I/II-fold pyridoxal phosphate-dependent enzyme [Dongia soli]|uniref:Aminotransferase class I/II-fold pyridoxal phosphate-dependent enzyme n=1 Tax=Dongia soli TaxID=600628 RepID=A0ABU5EAC8_9PROT|nr:aminotransferase class I/II-fold pyridoxal phosphate-dependent enzyme [Dongia soli]MDY0883303.1 aminotransferase class I/II-fold pyridoxal phosphate-dependent enzyme [Dongia soli]